MEQPAEGLWTGPPVALVLRELDAFVRDVTAVTRPGDQTVSSTELYLWLGQYDLIRPNSDDFNEVWWEPGLPGFRNSATFRKILIGMGVPVYWRQTGFPPQCRAVGANDFTCD